MQSGDLIPLPCIRDERGSLSVLETGIHFPFPIKRIYYLHKIPDRSVRGAHAHKALHQAMIAMNGSFDLRLDDGHAQKEYTLNCRERAVYIGPMVWRELCNFSADAICMVLASEHYDETDYYRSYEDFIQAVREKAQ